MIKESQLCPHFLTPHLGTAGLVRDGFTYLERRSKFQRHDVVQYGIDGGGYVVEHAGHVRGDAVQLVQEWYVLSVVG